MGSKNSKYLLAGGGLAVVGFAVFLLTQMGASESEAAPAAPKATSVAMDEKIASLRAAKLPELHDEPVIVNGIKKIDPRSDEMIMKFDEVVPGKVTAAAAECYHPGPLEKKSRNQHLKMTFTNVIKDGVVTIKNLKVVEGESNLNDATMQKCMFDKVAAVKWENPELPDGEYDDMIKIAPERGMKKYTKENLEYEGDPAGLPVGKAVMTPNQPKPVSDTATRAGAEAAEAAGR